MSNELSGRKVAFLTAMEGVEQAELTGPWQAVLDAGGTPELLAPEPGKVQAFNHLDRAGTFDVTATIADADPAGYDAMVLPGGVANADFLRTVPEAVQFVAIMSVAGRPAAVICHGPWTLIEAGLVRDRTLTSWPACRPTSATPAVSGSTPRSGSVPRARTCWSLAASPTTCPRSAPNL